MISMYFLVYVQEGSIGWGVALILGGGLLFLFSSRRRNIVWLPLLSLWGLSALPFSLTASGWETGNQNSWLFVIPFLPAQALLISGAVRHMLHPGETSLESQERWTRFLYPAGLFVLAGIMVFLGIGGWEGSHRIGQIWAAIIANLLAVGLIILVLTIFTRSIPVASPSQWTRIFRLEWLFGTLSTVGGYFSKTAEIITKTLEGEGGLLWSFLLLTLILSVLSTRGH